MKNYKIFFSMETSLTGKALNFGFNEYGFESRVSNLLYNYSINYLMNHLVLGIKNKKMFFLIQYNKKYFDLLKLLKNINFISSFSFILKNNKKHILISPKYNKIFSFLYFFKLLSTPTKKYFISVKALKLLSLRSGNAVYVLSTDMGILTHFNAINKNVGGFLLGFLHF